MYMLNTSIWLAQTTFQVSIIIQWQLQLGTSLHK